MENCQVLDAYRADLLAFRHLISISYDVDPALMTTCIQFRAVYVYTSYGGIIIEIETNA
jgi:hypothetical protein